MSKKRVVARSTMTLKDFHGGSIPSDLPLPSAPGKAVDRSPYERQSSGAWMIPSPGRGHTLDRSGFHRQGSANGICSFEDKASYFPNPANIGRNYDEDERKPVDGRPRSSHSAEPYDVHDYDERRSSYVVEEKGGNSNLSTFSDRSGPTSGYENTSNNRYQLNVSQQHRTVPLSPEVISYGQPQYSQSPPSNSSGRYGYQQPPASPPQGWRSTSNQQQQAAIKLRGGSESSTSNVWTARREGEHSRGLSTETDVPRPPSPWMPQNNMVRVTEASAIEKVSSGRWQPDYTRIPSPVPVDHNVPEQIRERHVSPHSQYSRDDFNSEGYYAPRSSDVLSVQEIAGHGSDRGSVIYSESSKISLHNASLGYPVNSSRVASVGRGSGYPDVSRISLHERQGSHSDSINRSAEGSLRLDHIPANCSESDKGGFSTHRALSDSARSRNAGYLEPGSRSGQGADVGQHRDAGQVHYDEDIRQESAQRSLNRDVEVGKASKGYSRTGHGLYARNHGLTTTAYSSDIGKNRHLFEGSLVPTPLERAGKVDSSERPQRAFPSEGSRVNHYSEDSHVSSYVEGPRVRYPVDERELKKNSSKSDDYLSFGAASVHIESSERPRLKLLPRSKPVEQPVENDSNTTDKSALQEGFLRETQLGDGRHLTDLKTSQSVLTGFTQANDLKSTATSPFIETEEDTSRLVERPKLNLKPRSQPVERGAELDSKDRKSVFGGARPRELVLKERGVEDPVVVGVDELVTASNVGGKVKRGEIDHQDSPRIEKQEKWLVSGEKQGSRQADQNDLSLERQSNSRFLERQDSNRLDRHDSGRDLDQRESRWSSERLGNQADPDRPENRRDQVRHDNSRLPDKQNATRDIDKQDSWRRPLDQLTSFGLQNQSKENYSSSVEKHSAGYGVKSGSYGVASADPKRLAALARSKLASGPDGLDHHADYEDFPGKRALPLRSQESYYD
ncbi:hypothetical protein O6H91_03G072200 [Diphasiastrum complanatum]|uniref:Uncharacterized protein n=5 Tax=Diphasiastrum complanatum TaxID=34168 RepID=A0ACC2E7R1_DIPCM|nr:hypothetical protein O6H91_03G072200 [Diphasiastrum complanatum]KAJ7562510.1 hypothetical protein O6H91_03G072200 [Diphasiastrum complanatum]KAJ7562511.1 hypothetical protein O6H91_03G072200 [Diphasiastrum complanatum]KAJ7562512.1 hypothetical protein O6H91_03G072200 [Diphasiastrum complanatum]KAJ7562513.1 hypothetical protein O6H91_03G072200 [Diphasiastrum complanatum]